jgi:hypothetical protein
MADVLPGRFKRAEGVSMPTYETTAGIYVHQGSEPVIFQLEQPVRMIETRFPPLERHWGELRGHVARLSPFAGPRLVPGRSLCDCQIRGFPHIG